LASNEKLTHVETQMMARWLTQQLSTDVRFLLRELLHGPVVQEKFDVVLIDCPPRIHTASINALAAADFLLVPVLLDLTSADSVPRLLHWVQSYRAAGVSPSLDILGVVANKKSNRRNELLIREENIWNELPGKCRVAWGGEVPFCDTVLPDSSAIAECAQTPGRFACEDDRLRPIFQLLASELERQMGVITELAV
jgi:cellulose biosynthesis protein BcsQ